MKFLIQKNIGVYEPLRLVNLDLISSVRATNSGTFVYSLSDGSDFEFQLSIRELIFCSAHPTKHVTKGSYEFCVISV